MLPLTITRLTSDSPFTPAELVLQDIAHERIPGHLYKYRDTGENTKKIFTQSKLYFAKPHQFNDPFDCQLTIDTTCTKAELMHFIKRNNSHFSRAEGRRMVEKYMDNPSLLRTVVNEAARESLGRTGICCFGPNNHSLLMWAHYSDSHRGLCLKFDVAADPDAFVFPFKVKYRDNYPRLNHIRAPEGASVREMVTTKSKDWEYENEYRVMKFQDAGLHSFKKAALVGVTFGCKASDAFIKEIKTLAADNGFEHLTFDKAYPSQAKFAVSIRPI
ncbi:DUF2971 domain-containing protein [Hymenobacter negativus]|uniref:DUF2971 domain-containing protein n=1 Tax=Hymenobacter negativus TaxID=2795026 RepID=A0ABS0QB12_9BACT|nr:DUF2971 domain-containing protein [Hymenobacter negativus]MBH8559866.1 DUF2971 domain-containing protein [Hymenobacter negativus]